MKVGSKDCSGTINNRVFFCEKNGDYGIGRDRESEIETGHVGGRDNWTIKPVKWGNIAYKNKCGVRHMNRKTPKLKGMIVQLVYFTMKKPCEGRWWLDQN